jgi:aspartyl-tRNA(Asn)/glutamyl-tRNA(Gln) amidotransferase subunit C
MALSKKELESIAELARLDLSEKEKDFYARELSSILGFVEQLNELDTETVEPTSHITGLSGVAREDKAQPSALQGSGIAEALIKCLPFVEKGYAKVRSVFTENT